MSIFTLTVVTDLINQHEKLERGRLKYQRQSMKKIGKDGCDT